MKKICWVNILICFLLIDQLAGGQSKLNFGMSIRQQVSDLPRSKAPVPVLKRKAYQPVPAELQLDEEGNLILSKGWDMIEGYKLVNMEHTIWNVSNNNKEWYNAVVPGTVLTTLVEQDVYPDPYYGLNNLLIPDTLCRMDWWYRIAFDMPSDGKMIDYQLLFNGINYKSEVWLNGTRLGSIHGAFKRGLFSVEGLLKKNTTNILAVHILPPNNPGIPYEENKTWFGPNGGALCLDGPTFISSEGWDWIPGIRDRNMGIWQDVRLVKVGNVEMIDPQIITDLPLPDTTSADLSVNVLMVNKDDVSQTVTVRGEIGAISFSQDITLKPNAKENMSFTPEHFAQLRIKNPALWWPNGYGAQPLYQLTLSVEQKGEVLQTKKIRFGIRELSYELMAQTIKKDNIRLMYSPTNIDQGNKILFDYKSRPFVESPAFQKVTLPVLVDDSVNGLVVNTAQPENPFLTICVNGQKIFCKGGNWGMDDGMKRVTRERLEPYFRLHKEAHYTMIRNWTGESTEELFYSLCDEYGLLVWNDFSISTQDYNLEPLDHHLFLDNARDIVRRFRNHPSIAIWCPRNEGYAPEFLETGFQQIIAQEDGTRHYHGNSRDLSLCSSGPWHYIDNQLEYLTTVSNGFSTELGAPSVPTVQTLRKFIPEEDRWPIGDVWYYHDLHIESFDWKSYVRDVNRLGKEECRNEEEFCTRAQFLNYNLHRNMFEAWNQKMWNYTSGLLLWMTHPAWPSVIWQTYSYDYETHGSYYGAKKACEPIHIQWNAINKKVQIINTTLQSVPKAKVVFAVYSLTGELKYKKTVVANVAMNAATDCFVDSIPSRLKELSLVRVKLSDATGRLLSENEYWVNPSSPDDFTDLMAGASATVRFRQTSRKDKDESIYIQGEIKNTSASVAVGVKIHVRDAATHEILLPVYVSEGYFCLLSGESKPVRIEIPPQYATRDIYITVSGLNIIEINVKKSTI